MRLLLSPLACLLLACMAPPMPQPTPFDPATPSVLSASANGVSVALHRAGIARVALEHLGEQAISDDELLVVTFSLTVTDSAKKIDYDGWASSPARLADDLGNSYRLVDFGFGTHVIGQVKSATVYTDKPVDDRLVFQRPVPAARKLQLELPASHVGGTGTLTFRFESPKPAPPDPPPTPTSKQKPAPRKVASPVPADPERRAAQRLEFAKALIADKKYQRAKERLNELIKEQPDTRVATEAKRLLDTLPSN